jgi:hypothetical protein
VPSIFPQTALTFVLIIWLFSLISIPSPAV